jgi:hypothetical protein
MDVAVVVVTHNRLEYRRKTIVFLLEDPKEEFGLYILNNVVTDKMVSILGS